MDILIYSLFYLFLFSCGVNCLFLFKCTQVGRIKCPLLLVTAGDDQAFPAVESADTELSPDVAVSAGSEC